MINVEMDITKTQLQTVQTFQGRQWRWLFASQIVKSVQLNMRDLVQKISVESIRKPTPVFGI